MAGDVNRPNGLAFSPDESKLYVVEAGVTPRVIRAYDVVENGTQLANMRPLITAEQNGTPDGLRVDVDGNLWVGWGMGEAGLDGVANLQSRRQADRPHRPARTLREPLLRRPTSQPTLHVRQHVDVLAVREHAGRSWLNFDCFGGATTQLSPGCERNHVGLEPAAPARVGLITLLALRTSIHGNNRACFVEFHESTRRNFRSRAVIAAYVSARFWNFSRRDAILPNSIAGIPILIVKVCAADPFSCKRRVRLVCRRGPAT